MKLAIIVFGLLVMTSCEEGSDITIDGDEISHESLQSSLKDFQWEILKKVNREHGSDKNLNISPISIAVALSMAYEGAAAETKERMASTLKLSKVGQTGQAYRTIIDDLNTSVSLSVNNAVFWDGAGMTPNESFLKYQNEYFKTQQQELDFADSDAVQKINSWAEQATEGRIKEVLKSISPDEVMFLMNALFFKSDWQDPFPIDNTRVRDFTLADGKTITTEFAHQDNQLSFYQGSDFDAVDLYFDGQAYSMTFLLPGEGSNPDQLIDVLDRDRIDKLYDSDLQTGRLLLSMPKFEVASDLNLKTVLSNMGMAVAFDKNNADFSNLGSSSGNLFISRVKHNTFLKVDEKGAEGAAVTTVGVSATSLPPSVDLDRPFVFLLRNVENGILVFGGKIEDPSDRIEE